MILLSKYMPGTSSQPYYRVLASTDTLVNDLQTTVSIVKNAVTYNINHSALCIARFAGNDGIQGMLFFTQPTTITAQNSWDGISWNTIRTSYCNTQYGNYYGFAVNDFNVVVYGSTNVLINQLIGSWNGVTGTITYADGLKHWECYNFNDWQQTLLDYKAYIESAITPSYTWSSVPSISSKNGILALSTLNDINDGEEVTTSDTTKFTLASASNVGKLIEDIVNE